MPSSPAPPADREAVQALVRDLTDGRGADGVVDAVGMEAHGNPVAEKAIGVASRLPKPVARAAIANAGIDRLNALHLAVDCARRGGTVSVSGVYGGSASPMSLMDIFDKGLTMRHGQCHVRAWTDDLQELATQARDPLQLEGSATHHAPRRRRRHVWRVPGQGRRLHQGDPQALSRSPAIRRRSSAPSR
ncbi:MAG: hypothetical protein ABR500_14010 [Dermatophilaceae bacterium]|nr:hypothetical protein [Intrasporangiaceae bacterium]